MLFRSIVDAVPRGGTPGTVYLIEPEVDDPAACAQVSREDFLIETHGMHPAKVLRLEIFPNLTPLLVTLLAVEMGIAILVEVILSFVGISVAGDTPTWGSMIAEGRQIVYQAPWIMALPIGCIISSVIGFNLLGDGLRLALDPVQRR